MKGRCKDCAHVEVVIAPVEGEFSGRYHCHRFPPTWPDNNSAFPEVGPDWWCGEFQVADIGRN